MDESKLLSIISRYGTIPEVTDQSYWAQVNAALSDRQRQLAELELADTQKTYFGGGGGLRQREKINAAFGERIKSLKELYAADEEMRKGVNPPSHHGSASVRENWANFARDVQGIQPDNLPTDAIAGAIVAAGTAGAVPLGLAAGKGLARATGKEVAKRVAGSVAGDVAAVGAGHLARQHTDNPLLVMAAQLAGGAGAGLGAGALTGTLLGGGKRAGAGILDGAVAAKAGSAADTIMAGAGKAKAGVGAVYNAIDSATPKTLRETVGNYFLKRSYGRDNPFTDVSYRVPDAAEVIASKKLADALADEDILIAVKPIRDKMKDISARTGIPQDKLDTDITHFLRGNQKLTTTHFQKALASDPQFAARLGKLKTDLKVMSDLDMDVTPLASYIHGTLYRTGEFASPDEARQAIQGYLQGTYTPIPEIEPLFRQVGDVYAARTHVGKTKIDRMLEALGGAGDATPDSMYDINGMKRLLSDKSNTDLKGSINMFSMKDNYLPTAYRHFSGLSPKEKVPDLSKLQAAIDSVEGNLLKENPQMGVPAAHAEAENIIANTLAGNTMPMHKRHLGSDALKQQKLKDPAVKDLLEEIDNPWFLVRKQVHDIQDRLNTKNMLNDLTDLGYIQKQGGPTLPKNPGDMPYAKVRLESYGILGDYYVQPDVANYLARSGTSQSDMKEAAATLQNIFRKTNTSMNPGTSAKNIVSNTIHAYLHGVPMKSIAQSLPNDIADIIALGRGGGSELARAFRKKGLFGTGMAGQIQAEHELYRGLGDVKIKNLDDLKAVWRAAGAKNKSVITKSVKIFDAALDNLAFGKQMGAFYGASEDVYKLMVARHAYENGIRSLADNSIVRPGDLDAAVEYARQALFDYSNQSQFMKDFNAVSPLSTYDLKVFPMLGRALKNNPQKAAPVIGLWLAADRIASMVTDGQYGVNATGVIPGGQVLDFARDIIQGRGPLESGTEHLVASRGPGGPAFSAVESILNKSNFTGRQIYDEHLPVPSKIVAGAGYFAKRNLTPGYIRQAGNISRAAADPARSTGAAVARAAGVPLNDGSLVTLYRRAKGLERELSAIRGRMKRAVQEGDESGYNKYRWSYNGVQRDYEWIQNRLFKLLGR